MQISYAITRNNEEAPMCIVLTETDAHHILMLLRLHTEDEYTFTEIMTQISDEAIESVVKDMMVI